MTAIEAISTLSLALLAAPDDQLGAGSIQLTTGQVIAAAAVLVAAIVGLFGLVTLLIRAVLKGPKDQLALLQRHIASLEARGVADRSTIHRLDERCQALEQRSFSLMETMASRYAANSERIAALSHHTVEVLDEMAEGLRRLQATNTDQHVAIKQDVDAARTHAKHLSGEHGAPHGR